MRLWDQGVGPRLDIGYPISAKCWCGRGESNPHGQCPSDFKSGRNRLISAAWTVLLPKTYREPSVKVGLAGSLPAEGTVLAMHDRRLGHA